jgi:carboxyl-terminal processing protease
MRQGPPQVFNSSGGEHIPTTPLVVLVDGSSASAAEIVPGALQDHDRALVVGTTSYGKGLVQTVFPLDGCRALKLTTGKWYTPSGRSIQKAHRPLDSAVVAGAATDEELPPDSLESDTVKKNRPAYKSDAGRVVYGGGGITPDVIVPDDTISSAEQEFAKSVAPKFPALRSVLYDYALQLKSQVKPDFKVKPEWRTELYRRLKAAKVDVDSADYAAAAPLVNQWISNQVARLAFGDSTAFRRDIPDDPQLQKAMSLLEKGRSQQDLFALARADSGTKR